MDRKQIWNQLFIINSLEELVSFFNATFNLYSSNNCLEERENQLFELYLIIKTISFTNMWYGTTLNIALSSAMNEKSMEWYDNPSFPKTVLSELTIPWGFRKRYNCIVAKCKERESKNVDLFSLHFLKVDDILVREEMFVKHYGYRFGLIIFCVLLRFWPRHKPIVFSLGEYETIVRKYQQEFRSLSREYFTQGIIPNPYPFYVNCSFLHEVRNIINEVVPYSEDFFEEKWKNLHGIIDSFYDKENNSELDFNKMFYWNRVNYYFLSKENTNSSGVAGGE